MNEQLESDLREALSRHAVQIPTDAGARLRAIDYRPRANRVSPRLTVGAVAAAAAGTGAVVSVVVLGSAQAAFAGWSPSPTSASVGQTSTADTTCQAQLAGAPPMPGATAGGVWTAVATDVRGPFTLVIYQNGTADATCITGPSVTVVSRSAADSGSMFVSGSASGVTGTGSRASSMFNTSGSGSIKQMSVAHLASTSDGPYTLVEGQVDDAVTAVAIVRSDGEHVQASTGDGWFVAWWPGSEDATSAQITTAAGVTTQPLDTPPPIQTSGSGTCGGANSQTTSATVACRSANAGGPISRRPAVPSGTHGRRHEHRL